MIEQNKLPDKYLVKVDKDHPLWNKFADYINILNNNMKEEKYTIQQCIDQKIAIRCYNREEGNQIYEKLDKHRPDFNYSDYEVFITYTECGIKVSHQPKHNGKYFINLGNVNGIKATKCIEFKQVILDNMNTENQEIVGYKLVKPEYEEAACKIIGCLNLKPYLIDISIGYETAASYKLKKAGVLDIWFTPIFKTKYELPVISSYNGKYIKEKGIIKYGCVEFYANWVSEVYEITMNPNGMPTENNRTIKSIVLDNGTVINSDQLKQIVDYINNSK